MADTFVTRLTGQETADAVPVEVQLVMTDRALLAGGPDRDETPAQLPGYGTVPAAWARALLTPTNSTRTDSTRTDTPRTDDTGTTHVTDDTGDPDGTGNEQAQVWLRRLYTHPASGALVAMDSTRRTFEGGLRRYLLTRDAGVCRTPWCDAPARHVDHIREHADGGPTSADNGQGLCGDATTSNSSPAGSPAPSPHPSPHPSTHPAAPETPARDTRASGTPSRRAPRPGTGTPPPRHPCSPHRCPPPRPATPPPSASARTAHSNAPSHSPWPPDRRKRLVRAR